ncbi:hypothetical protein NEOLEDRAFT_1148197 [Neolentinus lepideus HHB14362 ss-1]|uniref:Uncharacterized protein n=1 Tax=Neolentinus lepideus HHB14362 ss-1 TaxID=1314782 RepID=A0A165SBD1_9AGAM|nr:hypothetical protein NEOLEDRAFT_1148197 [Neolentinus lepideus HHB14362 ss-1]
MSQSRRCLPALPQSPTPQQMHSQTMGCSGGQPTRKPRPATQTAQADFGHTYTKQRQEQSQQKSKLKELQEATRNRLQRDEAREAEEREQEWQAQQAMLQEISKSTGPSESEKVATEELTEEQIKEIEKMTGRPLGELDKEEIREILDDWDAAEESEEPVNATSGAKTSRIRQFDDMDFELDLDEVPSHSPKRARHEGLVYF